jgi:pimeloyl-ACP methyl ester carboxylesterase
MFRITRWILGLTTVLAPLSTVSAPGHHRVVAQEATADATPIAMPATPVGDQLGWVLAQLNGGAATLTEAELAVHVTPTFLAGFPFPLLDLLRDTAAQYAPVVITGFPFPSTSTGAVATVDLATGEQAALYLVVEPLPPHRITRLDLSEAPGPFTATGRRVDIGGRALYLDCQGSGGPTVVLEGGIASDWMAVQPAVAKVTRVCSYDRPDSPGSRSDPAAQRTAQDVVDDLRALLTAAGEPGPYVLVGHSMGGLYVQLYAYQHPDDVAGLVLVDPTPEEFSARLVDLLTSLGTPAPESRERPTGEPTVEETSFQQVRDARAAGTLRSMPLIVLSHGRAADPADRPPGWPVTEEEQVWRELQAKIAHLVPNGRHVVAAGSGHDIHAEQPDLVVDAIGDVVTAVRDPSAWATPAG